MGKERSGLRTALFVSVALPFLFAPAFSMFFGSWFSIAAYIGSALALFSLSNALATYNLALHKTSFVYLLSLLLALEVAGIYLFHHSLLEVAQALLVTNVLVLGYLLICRKFLFRSHLQKFPSMLKNTLATKIGDCVFLTYSRKAFGVRDLGIKGVVG